jgi:hypothetical protein
MIGRMFFKFLSESKQITYLQEKGTVLGTRIKNGRKAYMYMIADFCVEVIFQQDNQDLSPECVTTFSNVREFNNYLEREFKTTF